MSDLTYVELDEEGRPLVNYFDLIASKLLKPVFVLFFYVGPLAVGLNNYKYLSDSTIVKLSSYVFSLIAGLIDGLTAYIAAFIVPHRYDFAHNVFTIIFNPDFRISMSFVTLMLFFTRPSFRIINRIVTSYFYRKVLFIIFLIFDILSLYDITRYLNTIEKSSLYVFCFTVNSVIFFILISYDKKVRKHRLQRPNTFNSGSFNL